MILRQKLSEKVFDKLKEIDKKRCVYAGTSEKDKLDYVGRHFGEFLQAGKKIGYVKNWYVGVDTKKPERVVLKVEFKDREELIYPINLKDRGLLYA